MANFGGDNFDYSINPDDETFYQCDVTSQYSTQHFQPQYSTQPFQPEFSQPSKCKPRNKKTQTDTVDRKVWSEYEDERLCKSWCNISTDRIVGNEQPGGQYWKKIHADYHHELPNGWHSERTSEMLRHHFGDVSRRVKKFQACFNHEERRQKSGRVDNDVYKVAELDFLEDTGKLFKDHRCFHVLKDQPKWHSHIQDDKIKKLKAGGSNSTAFDIDDEEVSISDKLERPKGRKAAKAEASANSSSSSSMMDFLVSYREEQSARYQISESNMSKMAAAAAKKAAAATEKAVVARERSRAQILYVEERIMTLDPNDPNITADRRKWILAKQAQIARNI